MFPKVVLLPDRVAVRVIHLWWLKRFPCLGSPKTFNEKVAWRKLFQHNPLFPVFADKVRVKAEITRLIGKEHVIPLLWAAPNPEKIPFAALIPPYVIKTNHDSGGSIFVRTAEDVDRNRIISLMKRRLAHSYGRALREWGYLDIPRQVLVERLIEAPGRDLPEDYRFFVYDGRVHFIHVDIERFTQCRRNLYDRDWNLIPGQFKYPNIPFPMPKPPELETMITLAEKIGSQFDFVRVDLYCTEHGIFFGETTFYPEGGIGVFTPKELDRRFGEPWKIRSGRLDN